MLLRSAINRKKLLFIIFGLSTLSRDIFCLAKDLRGELDNLLNRSLPYLYGDSTPSVGTHCGPIFEPSRDCAPTIAPAFAVYQIVSILGGTYI